MADHEKCTWTGQSGTEYPYFVWELPANLKDDQDGNYIYSKKNDKGRWVPIYIGEGDLADRISDNHHQAGCIKKKGPTHVRLNQKEKDRTAEEADLLAHYTNAYTPSGCNEKEGG